MEILIDIPEHQYNNIMTISSVNLGRSLYKGVIMSAVRAIQKGTVLPKGHGRLVDADEIDNNIYDLTRSMDLNYGQISEVVDTAPTIIEKDSD